LIIQSINTLKVKLEFLQQRETTMVFLIKFVALIALTNAMQQTQPTSAANAPPEQHGPWKVC